MIIIDCRSNVCYDDNIDVGTGTHLVEDPKWHILLS